MHFCTQLQTLDTFLEAKRVYQNDFDDLFRLSHSKLEPIYTNTSSKFSTFHKEFNNFKKLNLEHTKRNDDTFIFGMKVRLMLDKKHSKEEMIEIARTFVKEKYQNFPFFCWYFKRGSAHYLIIFICDRRYFNGKTKTISEKYSKDVYENSVTHKFCSKDDDNAVLKFKKGDIRTSYKAKFSKKKQGLFYQFGNFSKEQFKHWSYHMRVYLMELLKRFGAQKEFGVTFTQLPHGEIYKKKGISLKTKKDNLIKCKYINKRIKECANYFTQVLNNLEKGEMLEESLIIPLKRLYFKYFQRIKNRRFIYKTPSGKEFNYKISYLTSWEKLTDSLDAFEELLKQDINNYIQKEVLGFD